MRKILAATFGAALLFVATPAFAAPGGSAPVTLFVKVPAVVGLGVGDAVKTLTLGGLVAAQAPVDDCAHVGVVLTQDPGAGVLVHKGSTVHLEVGAVPARGCP